MEGIESNTLQYGEPKSVDDRIIAQRKAKVANFLKNSNWVVYIFLAIITFIAVRIRTRNIPGLRDITTGGWTLGPDLDPFLFLRWAKYIVENGKLFAVDMMRYVPLGFETSGELPLHPYLMAWFHKVAVIFGSESVTQSAVYYPVAIFALTVVAFFLLSRKIFLEFLGQKKANLVALGSALFIAIIPVILPRTIAGIPEKESPAFLFFFLALYFFISAWKDKKIKYQIAFAILAGMATAAMMLVWGGSGYIFLIINISVLLAFILGKVNIRQAYVFGIWIILSALLSAPFTTRITLSNFVSSLAFSGASLLILFSFFIYFILKKKRGYIETSPLRKIPLEITSLIIATVIGAVLATLVFGIDIITSALGSVIKSLVNPVDSRLILTVAENRQPFFLEWASSFGPSVNGILVFFWLFFFGSIFLFANMIKAFSKKEKFFLTASYIAFLFALVFNRYSPSSSLNGTNFLSNAVLLLGFVAIIGTSAYYYYRNYKAGHKDKLRSIDFGPLMLLSFLFIAIISAKSAVRLIMILAPPTAIVVSYFAFASYYGARNVKDDLGKMVAWVLVALIILSTVFAAYNFYRQSDGTAKAYVPSGYTQQWQKAMSWVRQNTSEDAVFGHWWDYGYWLQSIGERATPLDGGNVIPYWNHLMGRHALTGSDNRAALDFLYAHDVTHFLIDSTDIGKYGAYSSIGSDENYDRRSWLPVITRDDSQTQERKSSTLYVYHGGTPLDGDIIYDQNGTRLFLPGGKAAIAAILIDLDSQGNIVSQPEGIFVYNGNQHRLPLRYGFGNKFQDFGSGVESGFYLMPVFTGSQMVDNAALIYLSSRTVKSQFARLYLYDEDNPNFKLAHSEDDFVVSQLKAQGVTNEDILHFQGVRGPIKIWEIDYPRNIQLKEEFLETAYPDAIALAG